MVRPELDASLHRLANYIECQLAELTREMLIDSRCAAARDVIYAGCSFIEELRDARVTEGGDA